VKLKQENYKKADHLERFVHDMHPGRDFDFVHVLQSVPRGSRILVM